MLKLPSKYHCPIKCSVKESKPDFLVLTDGIFYLGGYLTKEALEAHKKNSGIALENLQGFLLDLNKWSLELVLH